ncbi:MAG: hypothetical protein QNJ97_01475 [Myxococcota bacterium]|nr:hypothetical protein [Myxococcota bacterium]
MKHCKRRGKVFFGIGVLAAVLVTSALIVSSCGRRHFDIHKDPDRLKAMVRWKVDDLLDEIDADDGQRRHILDSVNSLVDEGIALHSNEAGHKEVVHAELAKERPDAEKLHAMVDQKFETWRVFSHKVLDVALDAHSKLTPEQREQLMTIAHEHHGFHQ